MWMLLVVLASYYTSRETLFSQEELFLEIKVLIAWAELSAAVDPACEVSGWIIFMLFSSLIPMRMRACGLWQAI